MTKTPRVGLRCLFLLSDTVKCAIAGCPNDAGIHWIGVAGAQYAICEPHYDDLRADLFGLKTGRAS
jgi:hypothetical protein